MSSATSITIEVKAQASEELESLLACAEQLKLNLDGFVEALQKRFDSARGLFCARQLDGDFRSATGARELRIALEPSDAFREFMAAFTVDVDGHVIQ